MQYYLRKNEKIAMWTDDDEQMINYEWPKQQQCYQIKCV